MKIFKSVLIRKWIASYIFVILVSIISMIILNISLSNIVENQVKKARGQQLEQSALLLNSYFKTIIHHAEKLAMTPLVEKLILDSMDSNFSKIRSEIDVVDELKLYRTINPAIESAVLFNIQSNIFYSHDGVTNAKQYYELENCCENRTFEQCRAKSLSHPIREFSFYQIDNKNHSLIYPISVPIDMGDNAPGRLYIKLCRKEFMSILNQTKENDSFYLIQVGEGAFFPNPRPSKLENHWIIKSKELSIANLTLFSYISKSLYKKPLLFVKLLSLFFIILSLMITIALSLFFSFKNYAPLKTITEDAINGLVGMDKINGDEYSILSSVLDGQKIILKQIMIKSLLLGKGYQGLSLSQTALKLGIKNTHAQFQIVLFKINQTSKIDPIIFTDKQDLTLNVLQYEDTDYKLWLIWDDKIDHKKSEKIITLSEKYQKELRDLCKVEITVAISSIGEQINSIELLKKEIDKLLEYQVIYGRDSILSSTIIDNHQKRFYFPHKFESELVTSLKSGKPQESKALLTKLWRLNFETHLIKPEWGNALIFSIAKAMQQCLEDLKIEDIPSELDFFSNISNTLQLRNNKERLNSLIELSMEISTIFDKQKVSRNSTLNSSILTYIEKEFLNINLSMTMVADYFKMNKAYLSRFFASQNGARINDYINEKRIEKAKKMLTNQTKSATEIALECGFTNIVTFMRIFKKREGITPGKFRDLHKN